MLLRSLSLAPVRDFDTLNSDSLLPPAIGTMIYECICPSFLSYFPFREDFEERISSVIAKHDFPFT
jgi:Zn-dependent M28 family amino/carboxypeptidase